MSHKEILVDVVGKLCPVPVIETKKVMEADPQAYVRVVVDNEVSRDNVVKLGEFRGYETHTLEEEDRFIVVLIPKECESTSSAVEGLSISKSEDLEELDLSSIFDTSPEQVGPIEDAVVNTTITGGDAPFYMSLGTGSVNRSIEAYEKMKHLEKRTYDNKEEIEARVEAMAAEDPAMAKTKAVPTIGPNKVILLTKDYLGEGSRELGESLMKTFLHCLTESAHKPKGIYFINSAVHMVCEASPYLEHLQVLHAAGVYVGACGICLDYYKQKDLVQVGEITNMYAIVESMMDESMVTL